MAVLLLSSFRASLGDSPVGVVFRPVDPKSTACFTMHTPEAPDLSNGQAHRKGFTRDSIRREDPSRMSGTVLEHPTHYLRVARTIHRCQITPVEYLPIHNPSIPTRRSEDSTSDVVLIFP